ncbi:WAP four-disulfide core domain protein 2 [Rousettus aegyptiacus]|uniref:WAP four-disulfide core domain protein 2 n=1 Tax=Rousettus aegyptiacus TaxID=9407 RepID=UPI00168D15D9|nr:WAP four-disulfide core domain protein 2 [Rousettus aegyptiacus]
MATCRPGPLVASLLAGLLLLGFGFARVTKTAYKKAGVCPKLQEDLNCTRECNSDRKCPENLKCCRAGCASVCHMPNEKPGTCPKVDFPLTPLGLCRDQCQVDSQCSGQKKCCRNGCGKVSCVTPVF